MAGTYIPTIRHESGFHRVANLLALTNIEARPDGTLVTPALKTPAGAPRHWREVAPFVWQDVEGDSRLAGIRKNGKVVGFMVDSSPPIMIFERATGAYAPWIRPILIGATGILALTVVVWPIAAIVRRRFRAPLKLCGAAAVLHQTVRLTALVDLVCVALWLWLVIATGVTNIETPKERYDPLVRLAQMLGSLGVIGAGAAVANLVLVWRDRKQGWWANGSAAAIAGAALAFAWLILGMHLLNPSLDY